MAGPLCCQSSGAPSCCSKSERCRVPITLILLILYFCYLLLGAAVFWALESKAEHDLTINFQQEKWELLRNHTCMDNKTLEMFISVYPIHSSTNSVRLDYLHRKQERHGIINAYKNGISLLGNDSGQETWDFGGSFFFSVTAITTIGYGNLSPNTVGGRIFCIFFALFGIPLNVILLNRIGQKMLSLVQRYADFLGTKVQRKKMVKVFSSSCALIAGLLLFFLLPPILFQWVEGWTYEEGFYYAFITLSTIGFGDYVIGRIPGKQYPNWYKNVVSLWILFGLAWLALIINLCINLLQNCRKVSQCCGIQQTYPVDQELIEISQNGHISSGLKEMEDSQSSTSSDTKPESPD